MEHIHKIGTRVSEDMSQDEMEFNRVNDNSIDLSKLQPMNPAEATSVTALIAYKAYTLNVGTDTIESALHAKFGRSMSSAACFDAVIEWLVDFEGIN